MGKYYRLNQNITAKRVRLIDEGGKQVGVVSLGDALKAAAVNSLDVVEIAPNAKPPVAKIVDFKKFKYEEAKRDRGAKKKTREVETKEIWLGPLMSEHDLENKLARARRFLTGGDRVKLTVKFGGREIIHKEFGYKILEKAVDKLSDVAEKDSEAKLMGRNLSLSLRQQKD